MPYAVKDWDGMDVGENDSRGIDLTPRLLDNEAIQSCTAALEVSKGTDPAAPSRMIGPVQIDSVKHVVSQGLSGLAPGVVYRLVFTTTLDSGRVIVDWSHVPGLSRW